MVKTGFHYVSIGTWNELKNNNARFIEPIRRLVSARTITDMDIPKLPHWAHDAYIFAFPDKDGPESWKKYKRGNAEWDVLTKNIGSKIIGFKFDLLPTDEAYVVDRSHFADWQYGITNDRQEAFRKYAFSRVPASEYDGIFRMPELLISNPIALDRLVVHCMFEREIIYNRDGMRRPEIEYASCVLNL